MHKYSTMTLFLCLSFCLLASLHSAAAELQTLHHQLGGESLSLLVVGDWGRRGAYNQSRVALQMGKIAEKLDIDFIISTGDNFYDDGLTDENDPAFEESFSNIYTARSLQKPWYTVLGNHDYRGNALAQLSPTLTHKDSRWFCQKSYILNAGFAEFFFVDTTPFQTKYFTHPKDHVYDWRGVLPRHKYISTLLKDLDVALRESTARWKIVVGHHTIKSAGHHGNTQELVSHLLPLLQANNVDFYVNGHDHCLEHIASSDSALQFFTSGGGSKAWKGDISWWDPVENKFYYDGQGFMSMQISPSEVDVVFYDVYGNVLHKWSTSDVLYNVM
ncbi:hypothetical protein DCAR_0102788 [Daucus carota subsp. sativus]|uniref:Purple acid phosphatase n=1 Tax=Daucus carota subsp. sativus TaxID=79200 RepID=A0AAF1AKJ3_DAUCS|nr:PREDICTED: purple acid phosphatase 3-like [Daucus carota subsp. sativus]WOG83611.1 hypothetical protein DCAR_0102788 [Daucus carota subsp. sativus]